MELINSSSSTQEVNHRSTYSTEPKWFNRLWTRMGIVARKIFKPIRNCFANDNKIHLIDDPSVVKDCQSLYDKALKDAIDEDILSCFMRLTYTLVHSTQVDDVLHGIDLLEEDLSKDEDNNNREQKPEKMYHLALGYYRCEQYERSLEFLERCMQNSPNHKKASTLLKKVEDQIRRDEIMCATCAGVTCFAGLLSMAAASKHSDTKKYEKLYE